MTTTVDKARPAYVLPRGVTSTDRLRQVLLAITIGTRPMLVGYWLVMLVLFLGISVGYLITTGGLDHSMWDWGTQSPKYFSMALGITIPVAYFGLLIAQGITRRMLSVATSIYLTGAAIATSTLWVLMYQGERVLYSAQGWSQKMENPHLFHDTSQAGLILTEFFLLILSHEAAGWLLGITFYRFGFWRGLLMLPLSLIPAVVTEFLLIAQWLADVLKSIGYQRPPLAVAVPSILVVSALGFYVGYLLLRPMALKPAKG